MKQRQAIVDEQVPVAAGRENDESVWLPSLQSPDGTGFYYPAIRFDRTLTITGENPINERLLETSVLGWSLPEIFLRPETRPRFVKNWQEAFEHVVATYRALLWPYLHEDFHARDDSHIHALIGQRHATLRLEYPDFAESYDHVVAQPIEVLWDRIMNEAGAATKTFALRSPFPGVTSPLSFVNFGQAEKVPASAPPARAYGRGTLIPTDPLTDVNLILLHLAEQAFDPDVVGTTLLEQLRWGTAILVTVRERLSQWQTVVPWEPLAVFQRAKEALSSLGGDEQATVERFGAMYREIIANLGEEVGADIFTLLTHYANNISIDIHDINLNKIESNQHLVYPPWSSQRTEERLGDEFNPERLARINEVFGNREPDRVDHPRDGHGFVWTLPTGVGDPTRFELFPERRVAKLRAMDAANEPQRREYVLDRLIIQQAEAGESVVIFSLGNRRASILRVYPSGEFDEYVRFLSPGTEVFPLIGTSWIDGLSRAQAADDRVPREVTAIEAARQLGMSRSAVTRLAQIGRLRGRQVENRKWLINAEDVARYQRSKAGRKPRTVPPVLSGHTE